MATDESRSTPARKHPIQVVARRTGLSADVIRVWERRYAAVRPSRTKTSRRLYSDGDVDRLLLLRRATLAGRRIGEVASLRTEELREMVEQDEAAAARAPRSASTGASTEPPRGELLTDCVLAIESLDAAALRTALSRAAIELSGPALIDGVLAPLLHEIGERWRDGTLRLAHEHMATAVIRSFLGALRGDPILPPNAPALVVTTPAGQLHELGALMAAVLAVREGWRVTYLGANAPADEIAAAAYQLSARAVALSVIYPTDDPTLVIELERLRELLDPRTAILVGGRAAPAYRNALDRVGAIRVERLERLRAELDRLRPPLD